MRGPRRTCSPELPRTDDGPARWVGDGDRGWRQCSRPRAEGLAAWLQDSSAGRPPWTRRRPRPTAVAPVTLRIIFPEGLHTAGDGRACGRGPGGSRFAGVESRRSSPPPRYRAADLARVCRRSAFSQGCERRTSRAFSFPPTYEFTPETTSDELVAEQLAAFQERVRDRRASVRTSKNLTAYDVLIIASMIEKEAVVPSRATSHRRSDLQPAPCTHAARDRRNDPLRLDIPGTKSLTKAALASCTPYNSAASPVFPRRRLPTRGSPHLQAAAHPARVELPLLRSGPRHATTFLHRERERVPAQGLFVRVCVPVGRGHHAPRSSSPARSRMSLPRTASAANMLRGPTRDQASPRARCPRWR